MYGSQLVKDKKYYLGLFFFGLSIIMPILGIFIPFLNLSTSTTALLLTFTLAGGPEIALLLAAAFWGKERLNYFKQKIFGVIKRFFKSIRPPQYVGKIQYYIWLTVWLGTSIPGILVIYFPNLIYPNEPEQKLYLAIMLDSLFIISFFMLGGQFWDKIAAIFKYEEMPNQS